MLTQGVSRAQVGEDVLNGFESLAKQVNDVFEHSVHRPASAADLNFWVGVEQQQGLLAVVTGAESSDEAFRVANINATHLVVTPIAGTSAGTNLTFAVAAEDNAGNVDRTFTGGVTLALATSPSGVTLPATTVAADDGIAVFDDTVFTKAGTYSLTATTAGLTGATSNVFTITAAAADHLAFTAAPTTPTTAGASFSVTVQALDPFGNVDATYSGPLTVAVGANATLDSLHGTATATISSGQATITGLSLQTAGTGYTLTAVSGTLTSATTSLFNVVPAANDHLAFDVTQALPPTVATAGGTFTVKVAAEDQFNNLETNFTQPVTLALGSGPTGAVLFPLTPGALSQPASSGIATFNGLFLTLAGTGYTLTASSTGLKTGTSSAFTVVAAGATQLGFTVPPADTTATSPFSVTVAAEDPYGNVNNSTFAGSSVTLSLGGTTLNGTTTKTATSNALTFMGLSINPVGTYTLSASTTGLTSATSSPFHVGPGAANNIMFKVEPTDTAADSTIPAVKVTVMDAVGNPVSTSVTLSLLDPNGTGASLSGTLTQSSSAATPATFSDLSINIAGSYQLAASVTGLAARSP